MAGVTQPAPQPRFSRSRPAISATRPGDGTRQPGGAGAMGSRPRAHREIDRERHRQQWRAGAMRRGRPSDGRRDRAIRPGSSISGRKKMDLGGVLAHGFHFEDVPLGATFRSNRRTITETDLVNFVNLTWFTEELFTNAADRDAMAIRRARGAGRTGLHLRGRPRRALDAAYGTSLSQCRDRRQGPHLRGRHDSCARPP